MPRGMTPTRAHLAAGAPARPLADRRRVRNGCAQGTISSPKRCHFSVGSCRACAQSWKGITLNRARLDQQRGDSKC
jgi:hypothetical protein